MSEEEHVHIHNNTCSGDCRTGSSKVEQIPSWTPTAIIPVGGKVTVTIPPVPLTWFDKFLLRWFRIASGRRTETRVIVTNLDCVAGKQVEVEWYCAVCGGLRCQEHGGRWAGGYFQMDALAEPNIVEECSFQNYNPQITPEMMEAGRKVLSLYLGYEISEAESWNAFGRVYQAMAALRPASDDLRIIAILGAEINRLRAANVELLEERDRADNANYNDGLDKRDQ